ncbi:Mucin-associated surface protein (MASP), subgroup S038 [Trypanosoma cruzi]|nr:Mucin-associated surface protein (MASP), subgroup S038 [Trypanosoma cruzi]
MAMMMTGRVLLVCALCVLWCGAGGIHARNPDNNSLSGYMASRGFGRKKSFLSNGSIKNLSAPLLLSASFISAIQAEAREGVSSPGVNNLPLSGATGLGPAFSGLGNAVPVPGPGPVRGAAFSGPDANIFGAPVSGYGPPTPGPAVPGHGAGISGADAIPGAAGPGAAAAFSGHAAGPAGPDHGPAFSGPVPAFSGLVPAGPGAGHSVVGGSEHPDPRSVVISSSQGGNGKTTPVSVSPDEQIASSKEVLAQKETGSQGTSSPEGQPTVPSNTEKQRNNSASAGGHSLGHDAAGDELQDSLEEQQKNDHSQTNETKKSSEDQNTESPSSGGALSEVSNTTTHGIKTQQPKTNSVNEKNYSQSTDASHTTSPLLLLLVVACAAAAVVAA